MSFLIGWWLFSTLFYFGLPIAAGYTTEQSDFFNKQIIGHIPLVLLCPGAVRCLLVHRPLLRLLGKQDFG